MGEALRGWFRVAIFLFFPFVAVVFFLSIQFWGIQQPGSLAKPGSDTHTALSVQTALNRFYNLR